MKNKTVKELIAILQAAEVATNVSVITEQHALELWGDRKRHHSTVAGDLSRLMANTKEAYRFETIVNYDTMDLTKEPVRLIKATWRVIDDKTWDERVERMKNTQRKFQQNKRGY